MVRLVAAVSAFALLAGAATAVAQQQEPSESDVAEARARFIAGSAAVEAGRWADAVDNFERAYALSEAPSALYNLGVALRALGQYRRAREVFDELLRKHSDELKDEMLSSAERYRSEVARRIAELELLGLDPTVTHQIRLDGREVPDEGQRPLVVKADPGKHALTASREGYRTYEWDGELEPGEHRRLRVTLEKKAEPTTGATTTRPEDDDGTILQSPWFWVVTGVVVLGAGGLASYFLLKDSQKLSPESDMPVQVP